MLSYEGIFFEAGMVDLIHSLETKKLARVNDEIHCTFKYHPTTDEIFNDIVGRTFEVYLIGYGNDEQNPTVLKTPHITASLAEGAKTTNTKNLNFKPLEKPVKLVGRFGYWIKGKSEEHLSYEPYLKGKTR